MVIFDLLAPIFALIVLGVVLHRVGLLPGELIPYLNRLLYWVGLPVVVFHSLAVAEPESGAFGPLLQVLIGATVLSVALAGVCSWALQIPARGRGTFIQAAFRGNLSFIGLPLLLTVPGVPRAPALMAMAPMLILYNVVAVVALVTSQSREERGRWRPLLREIARNPIILASLAGAGWHSSGWVLPTALERTLGALAQMTLPLALLCIGAALLTVPLRGNRRVATVAAVHKVALSPFIGYVIGRALEVDPPTLLAALLCLACPTAAVSYTMAKQFDGDEGMAATSVVISAVLSAPALALILAWLPG